ncbi:MULTISPECIES: Hha toxicity modulator TomB [Tatumella]|uniref:Hha toxicity modulator TomB n=1 Tax=Tatumella punctata TaxID=399969 RepID=A0ABW1VQE3_9GAMM|nr:MULTISPECIES: Hha toxicity modulator TomB [unclassified Tatumella]MBS0854498.1 Hha toxicity modulator TomB [Tatumella sp. JGM16]MBS0875787.1 Hha toxicity modulator TomB [Tatumella sp. JGM82]MBS0890192.1 Hha toxicity modulator TomB [Tatumella sp. JGM94]MBS0893772.1 Hha toxicity modulator TomB [Tatumella sp. JGM130]MBS0900318.1 Hha toxicity modulator TomB [Tatumella sp. JGM100]
MDEYSPKRYDVAQLKFLCENLFDESIATLNLQQACWINDPASAESLQLHDLIEHIAAFSILYKLKHSEDELLIQQVDKYLDDTFTLFSGYTVNKQDFNFWKTSSNQLFRLFFDTRLSEKNGHSVIH